MTSVAIRILICAFLMHICLANGWTQVHPPNLEDELLNAGLLRIIQDPDNPPQDNGDGTWTLFLKVKNANFIPFTLYESDFLCKNLGSEKNISKGDANLESTALNLLSMMGVYEDYDQAIEVVVSIDDKNSLHIENPNDLSDVPFILFAPFIDLALDKSIDLAFDGLKKSEKIDIANQIIENLKVNQQLKDAMSGAIQILISFDGKTPKTVAQFLINYFNDNIKSKLAGGIKYALEEAMMDNPELPMLSLPSVSTILALAIESYLADSFLLVKVVSAVVESYGGVYDLYQLENISYCIPVSFDDNLPSWIASLPNDKVEFPLGTSIIPLQWNFGDPDGDPMIYDVWMKGPNDQDLIKIADDISSQSLDYLPQGSGVYEWKVTAQYPWPSVVNAESEVRTFTYNCGFGTSINIESDFFEMLCNQSGFSYDLKFAFSDDNPFALSYTGYVYYLDESSSTVTLGPFTFEANVSSPNNVIPNLPEDSEILIHVFETVSQGETPCNSASMVFRPYPKIKIQPDVSNCHSTIEILELGSMTGYDFEIDGIPISISHAVGSTVQVNSASFGANNFAYSIAPNGSQCSRERFYSYTCFSNSNCNNGLWDIGEQDTDCGGNCDPCPPNCTGEEIDLQNGLIAYYPFNGNANDESGNGHHGTVNSVTLTPDRFGNFNSAFDFDGTNSEVQLVSSLLSPSDFTISIWFRNEGVLSSQQSGTILSQYDWFDGERNLWIRTDEFGNLNVTIWYGLNSSESMSLTTYVGANNGWHNLILAFDVDNNCSLYIDEELRDENIFPNAMQLSNLPLKIGNEDEIGPSPGNNHHFNGQIDDLMIFNRTLNCSELSELYTETCLPYRLIENETFSTDTFIYASQLIDLRNITVLSPFEMILESPQVLIDKNCNVEKGGKLHVVNNDGCIKN